MPKIFQLKDLELHSERVSKGFYGWLGTIYGFFSFLEYFYTAPELKDPEELFISTNGLTKHEKVRMDIPHVHTINVFVPNQKDGRGWFRGFKPDQNGYFKDSVSATVIEMLKKSISVNCNSSKKSNNNNNDTFDESIRKSETIKKSSHGRYRPYILRRTIWNQCKTRQG